MFKDEGKRFLWLGFWIGFEILDCRCGIDWVGVGGGN